MYIGDVRLHTLAGGLVHNGTPYIRMRTRRKYPFAAKALDGHKRRVYTTCGSRWMSVEGATRHVNVAIGFAFAYCEAPTAKVRSTTSAWINLLPGCLDGTPTLQRGAGFKFRYKSSAGRLRAPGLNQFFGNMLDEFACEMKHERREGTKNDVNALAVSTALAAPPPLLASARCNRASYSF